MHIKIYICSVHACVHIFLYMYIGNDIDLILDFDCTFVDFIAVSRANVFVVVVVVG